MSQLPEIDSPEAARGLREYLRALDAGAYARGRDYLRQGRVLHIRAADDQAISATVRGAERYAVELVRDGHHWSGNCSCPVAGGCEHVVATALKWMDMCGVPPSGERPPRRGALPPAVDEPFRAQWQPVLEKKNRRPLTADEAAFLGHLARAFQNFSQAGVIMIQDVQPLGLRPVGPAIGTMVLAHDTWWETPPADAWGFWQFIACELEQRGQGVPEFMLPLTDTTAARASREAGERRVVVEKWRNRLEVLGQRLPAAKAAASGPAPGLDLRVVVDGQSWTLETRPGPAAPWKAAGRNFLDRFLREDATALTSLDLSPEVCVFLALCRERASRHRPVGFGGTIRDHLELLHALVSNRLARLLVVDPEGRPFAMSEGPVSWRMTRLGGGEGDFRLELVRPDGGALPDSALHLPGPPDLYLHAGVAYPGPPGLSEGQAVSADIPREVIEQPEVLLTLKRIGTQMPAEIERRFVKVALRARVECELITDFTERELLALRLTAVSEEPAVLREWTLRGWEQSGPASGAARRSSRMHVVDSLVADQVAGGLAGLGVNFDVPQGRWVRRVTRSFPDEFLAWRAALPPEVEVVAHGELASLLGDPVRARVEFELLETAAHRDWFDLALALKPEDTSLTAAEIALLLKARGKLVRLDGRGWRRLEVQLEGAPLAALEAAGFNPDAIAEAAAGGEKHRLHALQLAQPTLAGVLPELQAEMLRSRASELTSPPPPPLPGGLRAELRPYQVEGYRFLAFLSENRLGGILADDMGLGKTLQALAWLLWLSGRQPKGEPLRVLVVCPKSVVGNWEAETAKFAPALRVVRFAGAATANARGNPLAGSGPLIVVANYVQLRLQPEFFQSRKWHAVVLDEGQFIKTPSSRVAQIARDLPGENRLVLTGTPIENRLLDLWSLFAFALPGLLGSQAAFKRQYPNDNPLALVRLRDRVRHFMLRRTKAQVASDLPPRTEEDVVVELEGVQAQLYQAELKRARAALLNVGTPRELDKARFHILASLMKLRQICCHPALVDPAHANEPSAKLEELLERLTELQDEGHQVLVFSQFVEMLEIIRGKLVEAKIGHLMLTGQTENREELVAQFQSDRTQTVFLLSLKAAGFGLNLTAASYVILYDPWWNPAVEAQAIDRTHRIGQVSPVNAYRLIAEGTVEEKIRGLQKEKAVLAGAVVQEDSLAKVLDLDTLREVLG